jgi:hypothetical protein
MKDDPKVQMLTIVPDNIKCGENNAYTSVTTVQLDGLVKIKFHPNRECNKFLRDEKTRKYKLSRKDRITPSEICKMQYFKLNCVSVPFPWTDSTRILSRVDIPNAFIDLSENAKVFWDFENNQALKKATNEDMKR